MLFKEVSIKKLMSNYEVIDKSDNFTYKKEDLHSSVFNNIYFQIFIIIIFCILILQIIVFLLYLCNKYKRKLFLLSPFARIKRKKGVIIELGGLDHQIRN